MSALTLPAPPPTAPLEVVALLPEYLDRLRPFTVIEYHRMIDAGMLGPDDRCELIEGHVVTKMGQNTPHMAAMRHLTRLLMFALEPARAVQCQLPIQLGPRNEPEPDFSVLRLPAATYDARKPTAADVILVVEVAHSTLPFDRGVKRRVYATAGLPAYWLVDCDARRIEVYDRPRGTAYARQTDYVAGDMIPIVSDASVIAELAVGEFLG